MRKVSLTDESLKSLKAIEASMQDLPVLEAQEVNNSDTLLLHIDIVEGFINEGALSSKRVSALIPYVSEMNHKLDKVRKLFIRDEHPENACEFNAYPPHCIHGSGESELVPEIQAFVKNEDEVFFKNSTNVFHADGFTDWLSESEVKTIILVGDVTDICVLQAGLSIQTWYNEKNIPVRLICVVDGVETFHLPETNHDGDLMNLLALYNLQMNGIELVQSIV